MRRWIRWLAAGLCLAGFVCVALTLDSWQPLDTSIQQALVAARSPVATGLCTALSALASTVCLAVLSVALVIFLRKKAYCIPMLGNLIIATVGNLALKALFQRERPLAALRLAADTGYSFPSGHAMAATAFYGFLIFLCWQAPLSKRTRRLLTAGLSALIALICLSRLYLGMHYFSDVLGGCLITCAYLIVYCALTRQYIRQGDGLYLREQPEAKHGGLLASFRHAADGLAEGLRTERNLIIHFTVMTLVILFGLMLGLSAGEWIACVILFGLVIGAELINTAIETTVDICMPHEDPRAKLAKDTAAGAVLACALAAAAAGLIIFGPKVWALLQAAL